MHSRYSSFYLTLSEHRLGRAMLKTLCLDKLSAGETMSTVNGACFAAFVTSLGTSRAKAEVHMLRPGPLY